MNEQPSPLGRNDDDRSPSPKRKKVRQKYAPKACVSCRRSKLKCSGDNPCQRCRDSGKRCFYSEDQTAAEALQNLSRPTRPQQAPTCTSTSTATSTATSQNNGSGLGRRNLMPRHQAPEPRASDATALSLSMEARMTRIETMMEALLHDRALMMTPTRSLDRDDTVNDSAMSMAMLDPINPALVLLDQASQVELPQHDSTSSIDPLLSTDATVLRVGNRNFSFPTPFVYQDYIDFFFREVQPFHPCIDEHVFRMRSHHMLIGGAVQPNNVCFLGLNYIMFAWQDIATEVASSSSNDKPPGWKWLQLADDVVGTRQLDGQGDLSLAQFLLFKALYYCLADEPSLAYTTIGLASRYAFHHGLNRQSSYSRSRAVDDYERLRTFWNILIADRRISLSCARPYSIRDLDVDVERPNHTFQQTNIDADPRFATDQLRFEVDFLECMIHWSRFAGSLWDSMFAVTASAKFESGNISTFDEAVIHFFQESYATMAIDPSQTRQVQYIHLSFNNLRLLARRQTILSLQFDASISHSTSELVTDTIARAREYEQASESPPHIFRHIMVSSLASSLLVLCSLLVCDMTLSEVNVSVWTPTYVSGFDTAVAMLLDLANHILFAQRVLVDFDRIVGIVQARNATWNDHSSIPDDSRRWDIVKSIIPPNVIELFPYREQIPMMQVSHVHRGSHDLGPIYGGTLSDRTDPWGTETDTQDVGRGVLWI